MVYCKLIKREGSLFTYLIGGYVTDITGEMVVDFDHGTFEITKEPERSKVYPRHISTLLSRVRADYERGIVKDRVAYEI